MDQNTAIILDTDIGFDPDDIFALLLLHKLAGENLKLLITANEIKGKRALFAKQILKLLDNTHTEIVQGEDLGMDKFTVDALLDPALSIDDNKNYLEAIKKIVDTYEKVIFIGVGGFTNSAHFIEAFPDDAKKVQFFIMGGAMDYERYPGWIEYNVKIDVPSMRKVVDAGCNLSLVMAQTTHNPVYEITKEHLFYKRLAESPDPLLKLLYQHCSLWFQVRGHGTSMHDPLTVVTALGYDFVQLNTTPISVDEKGTFQSSENGAIVNWSDKQSDAQGLMDLLMENILNIQK